MASIVYDSETSLTAGGILSILAGVSEVIFGGIMLAEAALGIPFEFSIIWIPPGWPWGYDEIYHIVLESDWLIIVGGLLVVLGIIAMAGGISAIRRRKFGLTLAGAICALPSFILGIMAIIFVSVSKIEFGAEREGNGA